MTTWTYYTLLGGPIKEKKKITRQNEKTEVNFIPVLLPVIGEKTQTKYEYPEIKD